jgi:hypothetical protein
LKDKFSNSIKRIGSIRVHQVCCIHLFHL